MPVLRVNMRVAVERRGGGRFAGDLAVRGANARSQIKSILARFSWDVVKYAIQRWPIDRTVPHSIERFSVRDTSTAKKISTRIANGAAYAMFIYYPGTGPTGPNAKRIWKDYLDAPIRAGRAALRAEIVAVTKKALGARE